MKTSDQLDNYFSSRLKDHSPQPPAHLWDRLDAALPENASRQKRSRAWYYAAASIVLLIAIGSTFYLKQAAHTASQGIALPADTVQLPESIQSDLSTLLPQNTQTNELKAYKNEQEDNSKDKTVTSHTGIDAKQPTAKAAPFQAPQEFMAKQSETSREAQPTNEAPSALLASSAQVEAETPAVPATGKVVIEIRSGFQDNTLVAYSEPVAEDKEPSTRKKVVNIFKKIKDIKNGDEQIELDELKQNLFALVPKNEKKDNHSK